MQVHFALQGRDLLIQAQHKDTDAILEVIPQEKLQGDLPTVLVHGYIHWLNLSTGVMELRPLNKIWEHSLDNWRIDCATGQCRMHRGREFLLDIHSPTWEMVSNRLNCLEVPENLIITTLNPIDTSESLSVPQLSVALPRYGLSFFVNEDENLESRDFKDMVYDENQCIGTLFGLESNRLVLRPKNRIEDELVHRCIIIRDILFSSFRERNKRPLVANDKPLQPITYHTYKVDTDLGCLTGYTSWRSKLYLAQLHIETNVDWRPDPLTGRTGIQEALRLLQSAGCRSVTELDTRHGAPELLSAPFYKTNPHLSFAIKGINYIIGRERFLRADQNVLNKFDPPTSPRPNVLDARRTSTYLSLPEDLLPDGISLRTPWCVNLRQLFIERCAPKLPAPIHLRSRSPQKNRLLSNSNPGTYTLNGLFTSLRVDKTDSSFKKQYISRLHDSARHAREPSEFHVNEKPSTEELRKHYVQCRDSYMTSLATVKKELGPMDDFGRALDHAGQWPQVTPNTLFRCVSSNSPIKPPGGWLQCIISLALLLLELQRSRRLLRLSLGNFEEELLKELENEGCDGWSAEENLDWLLIQVRYS